MTSLKILNGALRFILWAVCLVTLLDWLWAWLSMPEPPIAEQNLEIDARQAYYGLLAIGFLAVVYAIDTLRAALLTGITFSATVSRPAEAKRTDLSASTMDRAGPRFRR
jgi:hypothetical protein